MQDTYRNGTSPEGEVATDWWEPSVIRWQTAPRGTTPHSSGTIPIATDEAIRTKKIRRGDIILLTAFGAGLTWGSVLARY